MLRFGYCLPFILIFQAICAQNRVDFEIEQINSNKGSIHIAVYKSAEEYPHNPFRTIVFTKENLQKGKLSVHVDDLQPGEYGFTVLDDENDSGTMEYNRLGFPAEGYGFGNNVKPFLRTPAFEKCVVKVLSPYTCIKLLIRR